jgi:hypothetical protein
MPTAARASIQNANSAPWSAEDIAKVQAVPGVLPASVTTDPTDPSLMLIPLEPAAATKIVRSIAKIFPTLPVKLSMA